MCQDGDENQQIDVEVDQNLVVHDKKEVDHDLEVRLKAGEDLNKVNRLQEEKDSKSSKGIGMESSSDIDS